MKQPMLKSLYSKLAAVLLGLFCFTGALFIILTVFSTEMYQSEVNQKLNLKLAENIVAEKLLMKDNHINDTALNEIFHMLMVINPSIELYLLNPRGRILAFSAPPEKVKRKQVDLEPIRKWFATDRTLPVMGDDPRNPDKRKAITVARIPKEGPLEGYLYIILGGEIYDGVMQKIKGSYILQLSFWVICAVVAVALITGFLVFALLTKRLTKLVRAMDDFKNHKTIRPLRQGHKTEQLLADEIDRLDDAFVRMAQHIRDQMQAIQDSDQLRRELIANISHDLRTPIATLQGYVETLMLKEQHLAPEERKNYLLTAHKHCRRLSALVEALFELAKLDASETKPRYEPFNLSDLVQDVVQKFQLAAEEKGIRIVIEPEDGLPLANADIGLMERALENLIENALQYTPSGGTISLTLTTDGSDIVVRVQDTGQGIPPEELPKIFNRFYQVDKSRRDPSGHSGLGLAITHRILELHHRPITVSSVVNEGTTFTFRVPVSLP